MSAVLKGVGFVALLLTSGAVHGASPPSREPMGSVPLSPVDKLSLALAKEHQQQGRLEDAEGQLDRLASFGLEDADAVALRGDIARERGDWAEAEQLFRRALELAPGQASYYLSLGQALQSQNKSRLADQAFARYLLLTQDTSK